MKIVNLSAICLVSLATYVLAQSEGDHEEQLTSLQKKQATIQKKLDNIAAKQQRHNDKSDIIDEKRARAALNQADKESLDNAKKQNRETRFKAAYDEKTEEMAAKKIKFQSAAEEFQALEDAKLALMTAKINSKTETTQQKKETAQQLALEFEELVANKFAAMEQAHSDKQADAAEKKVIFKSLAEEHEELIAAKQALLEQAFSDKQAEIAEKQAIYQQIYQEFQEAVAQKQGEFDSLKALKEDLLNQAVLDKQAEVAQSKQNFVVKTAEKMQRLAQAFSDKQTEVQDSKELFNLNQQIKQQNLAQAVEDKKEEIASKVASKNAFRDSKINQAKAAKDALINDKKTLAITKKASVGAAAAAMKQANQDLKDQEQVYKKTLWCISTLNKWNASHENDDEYPYGFSTAENMAGYNKCKDITMEAVIDALDWEEAHNSLTCPEVWQKPEFGICVENENYKCPQNSSIKKFYQSSPFLTDHYYSQVGCFQKGSFTVSAVDSVHGYGEYFGNFGSEMEGAYGQSIPHTMTAPMCNLRTGDCGTMKFFRAWDMNSSEDGKGDTFGRWDPVDVHGCGSDCFAVDDVLVFTEDRPECDDSEDLCW